MSGESIDLLDDYWRQKRQHQSIRLERVRQTEARLSGANRSELVHRAMTSEGNRFRLAHLTIKAARRFHVQTERIETTISDSLRRIGSAKPEREPEREKACQGSCPALPRAQDCASEVEHGTSNLGAA